MDLARQEYPGMLAQIPPTHAIRILHDRLDHIGSLNNALANWLQERRRIEEVYAQSLRKLATGPFGEEELDLGVFGVPLDKIRSSTKQIASSHQSFAHNIEHDIEKPLREFSRDPRLRNLSSKVVDNLQHTARDIEDANKKADKLKDKGTKAAADKVATAATDVERAIGDWESEAPLVFESLQEVDEARWDNIKNVLTQLETYASDMSTNNSSAVMECLNALLEVTSADEITSYSIRAPMSAPPLLAGRDRRMSHAASVAPAPAASSSLAPPVPSFDDFASHRSDSFQEKPKKESMIRRLKTVVKGRRQSTHPYSQPLDSPDSAVRKQSSSNLGRGIFGRRKDKENSDALSPPPTRGEAAISSSSLNTASVQQAPLDRRPSHQSIRGLPDITRVSDPGFSIPNGNGINGNGVHPTSEAIEPSTTTTNTTKITDSLAPPLQPTIISKPSPPVQPSQQFPTTAFTPPPISNSTILEEEPLQKEEHQGSDAIDQAMREAALVNDSGNNLKVDIRNAPIQEEDGDASAALVNVASALRASATPRRNNTVRGRRDRNTILIPSNALPDLPLTSATSASSTSLPNSPKLAPVASPVIPSTNISAAPSTTTSPQTSTPMKALHRSTLGAEDANSDTHSIRSGKSLSSSASATIRHPDLHEPGLNASIVETNSAWFSDGKLDRAMQIGEIALAFNPIESEENKSSNIIRINNFSKLEKVAPNPHFMNSVESQQGQYEIDMTKIPKTTLAFKYQIHIDSSDAESFPPIIIKPRWMNRDSETLLALSYSLNPQFPNTSLSISNFILIVSLSTSDSSSSASSASASVSASTLISRCQASNGGIYSREKSLIYWRLGDVSLQRDQPGPVLKAKLVLNEAHAATTVLKPGTVESRWEVNSHNVLPGSSGAADDVDGNSAISISQSHEPETDPFADLDAVDDRDEENGRQWAPVSTVRRLRSGTYVVNS